MDEPLDLTDRPRRRALLYLLLFLVMVSGLIAAALEWRKNSINDPVQTALAGETGAQTVVYRRSLFGGNDVVFDVRSATGAISMADITRRLLKAAEALKDHPFDRVYLAYNGKEKFFLDGAYFQQIGQNRETENPVYTARTMPQNVHNLDGTAAFQTWNGGLLFVVDAQMQDFTEFHRKWWADDVLTQLH